MGGAAVSAEREMASRLANGGVERSRPFAQRRPRRTLVPPPLLLFSSVLSPTALVTRFPDAPAVATLHDVLEDAARRFPSAPYLGQRAVSAAGRLGAYDWMSYEAVAAARTAIGAGLVAMGVTPKKDAVGLYGVNARDWVLVDAALHAFSLVSVPLYDTLGEDAVRYICSHAELTAVAASAAALPTLLHALPHCPTVKLVVVWGLPPGGVPPPPPPGSAAKIVTLAEVAAAGRARPAAHVPPSPSDVATLCYTSGTTGVPKGAILKHAALVANAAGSFHILSAAPGDVHISYLPLAHIYERVTLVGVTHCGVAVGFYGGDVANLLDDVAELKPTIFCSVPRLWNRVHDRIHAQIASSSPVARALFAAALAHKKRALAAGDPAAGSGGPVGAFWDALVFSKIRAKLGGRVRMMTSGASPISADVIDFMRCVFGATVVEGYGMTETACTISLTLPAETRAGHVGGPVPSCEVKLVDIPDMNYTTRDVPNPRGEVCVRGPTLFSGYHKDAAQSAEIVDADGWLHTGDVGEWLPGGRLKIIDRKKNIFKLAQGEYVAPEKVEGVYVRSPLVAQAFVYGDSLRAQLVAVIVPDPDALLPWAKAHGLSGDVGALCANKAVRAAVLASVRDEGDKAKLRGFEQVAAVALTPDPFSVDNGLLTPTFKLKRPQAHAAFKREIDEMYGGLA